MKAQFSSPSRLAGSLRVPASKSYTHRALIVAALLAGGRVHHPLKAEDTDATREAITALGVKISDTGTGFDIETSDQPQLTADRINTGESGTLLRFLTPICSVIPGPEEVVLEAEGTLLSRSHEELVRTLRDNGFKIEATGSHATAPLTCFPGQQLPETPLKLTAQTTSQHLSGWLIALAFSGGGDIELAGKPVSAPYLEMTARLLRRAGVSVKTPEPNHYRVVPNQLKPLDYEVPGDYSSAAFHIIGSLLTEGKLELQGLVPDDPQADRQIISLLANLGAPVAWQGSSSKSSLEVRGPFRPPNFHYDAGACPDLVPVLAVFAAFASGEEVVLENIAHLKNKESDRLAATCTELNKTAATARASADKLIIKPPSGNFSEEKIVFNTYDDHRIAMAFSIFALVRGNCELTGVECVNKSYPNFYDHLSSLGVNFDLL